MVTFLDAVSKILRTTVFSVMKATILPRPHTVAVRSVEFSPDGKWVVSGSRDRTVKVWNAETGEMRADCAGHSGWVTSVGFSPDGEWIASGSDDGTVRVWETTTGQPINIIPFSAPIIAVKIIRSQPLRLIVATKTGDVYVYQVPRDRRRAFDHRGLGSAG